MKKRCFCILKGIPIFLLIVLAIAGGNFAHNMALIQTFGDDVLHCNNG